MNHLQAAVAEGPTHRNGYGDSSFNRASVRLSTFTAHSEARSALLFRSWQIICFVQGQRNEFVVSPRKAAGAPVTDVTAASAFAAEGSKYSFAGEQAFLRTGINMRCSKRLNDLCQQSHVALHPTHPLLRDRTY